MIKYPKSSYYQVTFHCSHNSLLLNTKGFIGSIIREDDNMYDYLISQGRIVDGTGNNWFYGDVGIKDGRIVAVGKLKGQAALNNIDANGMVVCPGFIDIHTHSDISILKNNKAENSIMQGVTTEVIGNCGNGAYPITKSNHQLFKEYLDWMLNAVGGDLDYNGDEYFSYIKQGIGINIASLIAHGNVRIAVMGFDYRKPNDDEMMQMESIVAHYMKAGAFGLSTGLIYPPGSYCDTEEIVRLSKVVSRYGGYYASHIRDEADTILDALNEAIAIGRQASVPVHISHHKVMGSSNWGKSVKTLAAIDQARTDGLDISCDVYPYLAGETSLYALLPPWLMDGGVNRLVSLIKSETVRQKIQRNIEQGDLNGWWNPIKGAGWDNIILGAVQTQKNKQFEGMSIPEISTAVGKSEYDVIYDLMIDEDGQVKVFLNTMCEEDLTRILKYPFCSIGSDGWAEEKEAMKNYSKVHPRNYGTFAKILGRYVRELKVLRLEEAIRKMTSLPASRLGLLDRGLIRTGMAADLVVLDDDCIIDTASYKDSRSYPKGIYYVFVNGTMVVRSGVHTGETPGRLLLKGRHAESF